MSRVPVRIRTFLIGTVLALLLFPTLAAAAGWLVERGRQQAAVDRRLDITAAYLTSHGRRLQQPAAVHGLVQLLGRLDLLAQVTLITTAPPGKHPVYESPALVQSRAAKRSTPAATPGDALPGPGAGWTEDRRRLIQVGTRKTPATVVADLYHRPASRAERALVALASGIVVLLAGLAVAIWLAGRWMVAPLARLSAQVDRVAGGELAIAVPRTRIGEIANIAQAVEGMTAALGESAHERAEADEARRFLVTSIAHDLRTPLFALRGHLQALGSRLGDSAVHLERAEARADALERLIGNLFAYTRDDFAQPALQLDVAPVAEVIQEVATGLEHTARVRDNTFDLDGDRTLVVVADRDRLKRALTNVLDNALRYSPAGAPVRVSWEADESTVRIAVRDQGPGIEDDLLPHVFKPGIRGAPADGASDGGAGLGLAIAERLLEHQHATLTARNHEDGGALVVLTVPRAAAAAL